MRGLIAAALAMAAATASVAIQSDAEKVAAANQTLQTMGLPPIDRIEQKRANCHNSYDKLFVEGAATKRVAPGDMAWAQSYEAARAAKQPCPVPPDTLLARANGHIIQTDDGRANTAAFATEQKDPVAISEIGLAYFNGKFGQDNVQLGYDLIRNAAELGDIEATYTQGVLIARGQIDNKADLPGGFALIDKAAQAGHVDALFAAGSMVRVGQGTKKDPKRAFDYYRRASERGHFYATFIAWDMLTNGDGVKKDHGLAYRLSRRLAADGHVYGAVMAASSLLQGKDVMKHQDEILYWMDFAIRNGDTKVKGQMMPLRTQVQAIFTRQNAPPAYQPRAFKACPMKRTCTVNHFSGLQSCTTKKDYWSDCDG
jgi:uncharacterized protein